MKTRQAKARLAQRQAASRDALMAGAKRVALRAGIEGFTLDAVAAECGVTKQGLLYHFASKDELVFEIFLAEWTRAADAIAEAVERSSGAAGALEAIVTSYVLHFAPQLELFRLVTQEVQRYDARVATPARLGRIRPTNDRMYAAAEARLKKARLPKGSSPRRLAFCAHVAAMGILAMKALTERFGDPLLHGDRDLIAEMSRVFASAVEER